MQYDLAKAHFVETTEDFDDSHGVVFDSDSVTLEGQYGDELAIFRARKIWTEVFETNFLLEKGEDYKFASISKANEQKFVLKCNFTTACGRYAFWRLINNQAPESQYLIETAHIPDGASHSLELLRAPDLRSIEKEKKGEKLLIRTCALFRKLKDSFLRRPG